MLTKESHGKVYFHDKILPFFGFQGSEGITLGLLVCNVVWTYK
jgi:hypothetical protein